MCRLRHARPSSSKRAHKERYYCGGSVVGGTACTPLQPIARLQHSGETASNRRATAVLLLARAPLLSVPSPRWTLLSIRCTATGDRVTRCRRHASVFGLDQFAKIHVAYHSNTAHTSKHMHVARACISSFTSNMMLDVLYASAVSPTPARIFSTLNATG